jgi:hypothetical protein
MSALWLGIALVAPGTERWAARLVPAGKKESRTHPPASEAAIQKLRPGVDPSGVGDGAQNDSGIREGRAVLEDCFSE